MRVVCISDTHEQHRKLKIPDGDLLIHAGDITYNGDGPAIKDFLDWFKAQPHRNKIFVAGNHDFWFECDNPDQLGKNNPDGEDFTYLHDEAFILPVDSKSNKYLKVWGSPFTPTFGSWAFMKDRGDEIAKVWNKIPYDTDILITHGPPAGILDETPPKWGSKHAGCWDLMAKVKLIKPKLHVFGHIHHGYGKTEKHGTIFVNASSCDENYDAVNPAIVVDL